MIAHEKLADAMFICTQDRQHVRQAIPALEKGYDLLLEKPIFAGSFRNVGKLLRWQRDAGERYW
mgnify:CR=1 FL=1